MGVQSGSGSEVSLAARHHLEHLSKSYTMQAQHDVHAAVLGTAAMPGALAPGVAADPGVAAPAEQAPEEGLGDNVEMF
jgi:hypothetical protein